MSTSTVLTLWPRCVRPNGEVRLSVEQCRNALDRYWGDGESSGLARQGPDYYAGAVTATRGRDTVSLEDLGWAVLLAGRPGPKAAQSLLEQGPINISAVPRDMPLEHANNDALEAVAAVIWQMKTTLAGVGIAIAVKMLGPPP